MLVYIVYVLCMYSVYTYMSGVIVRNECSHTSSCMLALLEERAHEYKLNVFCPHTIKAHNGKAWDRG